MGSVCFTYEKEHIRKIEYFISRIKSNGMNINYLVKTILCVAWQNQILLELT